MPKILYLNRAFRPSSQALIDHANEIIAEYQAQGLTLTLRQLYYQFVARDLLPNVPKSYKNLGSLINDARLAGQIDWLAVEDRTRNLITNSHWDDPSDLMRGAANGYMLDRWADQRCRVEVWIEKEALAGVLQDACSELDVPFFACRGYTSASELWRSAMRMVRYCQAGQKPVVIHLGDHDPSGIDMTRDIGERLRLLMADKWQGRLEVERIALNMDQVEEYEPPPNPAKVTDSRFADYQSIHGDESWELDALDPATLVGLVRHAVAKYRNDKTMARIESREAEEKRLLTAAADRWAELARYLEDSDE